MFLLNIYTQLIHLIKSKITILLTVITVFLLPIAPLILTVGLFIVLDFITGILKAIKLKEKITSKRLSDTATKMVKYLLGMVLVYLLNIYVLDEILKLVINVPLILVKAMALFFCYIESVSLNENILVLTGVNWFAKFRDFLKRAISVKKEFKSLVKDDEDEAKAA